MAFNASGCFVATCSELKSPHEMPIMPTLPVHQGLRGKPGDDVDGILQFLLGIFVLHQAFGITVAAHVDAHSGVAVAGKMWMGERVARRGAVALAIGQIARELPEWDSLSRLPASRRAPTSGSLPA